MGAALIPVGVVHQGISTVRTLCSVVRKLCGRFGGGSNSRDPVDWDTARRSPRAVWMTGGLFLRIRPHARSSNGFDG